MVSDNVLLEAAFAFSKSIISQTLRNIGEMGIRLRIVA